MTDNITAVAMHGYAAHSAVLAGPGATPEAWGTLPTAVQAAHVAEAHAIAEFLAARDGEAPSTVTVEAGTGTRHHWLATAIERGDDGELYVGDGEKGGVDLVYAIYPRDHWTAVEVDGHRAQAGPDLAARVAGLEAELKVVLNIATGRDTIGGADALEAIRERVARALPDAAS